MGDRAQVKIVDTGVYLYTHWEGSKLPETVQRALQRKQRWDDPEYLTRIIFSEMIKDEIGNETGYGIGVEQHGDVSRVVEVDCEHQLVTLLDSGAIKLSLSFNNYCTADLNLMF